MQISDHDLILYQPANLAIHLHLLRLVHLKKILYGSPGIAAGTDQHGGDGSAPNPVRPESRPPDAGWP